MNNQYYCFSLISVAIENKITEVAQRIEPSRTKIIEPNNDPKKRSFVER